MNRKQSVKSIKLPPFSRSIGSNGSISSLDHNIMGSSFRNSVEREVQGKSLFNSMRKGSMQDADYSAADFAIVRVGGSQRPKPLEPFKKSLFMKRGMVKVKTQGIEQSDYHGQAEQDEDKKSLRCQKDIILKKQKFSQFKVASARQSTTSLISSNLSDFSKHTGISSTVSSPMKSSKLLPQFRRTLEQVLIDDVLESICEQIEPFSQQEESVLNGHEIVWKDRKRMVDWMNQVFRVLKVQSPGSIFTAVSLMDRYFKEKQDQKVKLLKAELLIIGLASIFVSSKYEETSCIYMDEILVNAGHNQFQKVDILEAEQDLLITLSFRIYQPSVLDESSIILSSAVTRFSKKELSKKSIGIMHKFVFLFSMICLYEEELMSSRMTVKAFAVPLISIKFTLKHLENQEEQKQSKTTGLKVPYMGSASSSEIKAIVSFMQHFEITKISCHEENEVIDRIAKVLKKVYSTLKEENVYYKNFKKNFPEFFPEVSN